jgi:acetyl-CoA carboxylase carboxyl transferase subunit beta
MVVHRHSMRPTIGSLLAILTKAAAPAELGSAPQIVREQPKAAVPVAPSDDDLVTPPLQAAHAE